MSPAPVDFERLARAGSPGLSSRRSFLPRIPGQMVALASVAFLSWASLVDNPAVCPDEVGVQGEENHRHDTPPTSHCCITGPCHTPTAVRVVALPVALVASAVRWEPPADHVLTSIDAPAPPTPPPTSLD